MSDASVPPPLRFVVLRHDGIADPHFDLMLETSPGSELMTFRARCWPIVEPAPLERLIDHRRAYLDYEGPLSGSRGTVRRVAAGTIASPGAGSSSTGRRMLELSDATRFQLESDGVSWVARPA